MCVKEIFYRLIHIYISPIRDFKGEILLISYANVQYVLLVLLYSVFFALTTVLVHKITLYFNFAFFLAYVFPSRGLSVREIFYANIFPTPLSLSLLNLLFI